MVCNRKKPESCFNCTLPDCLDTTTSTDPIESEYLRLSGIHDVPKPGRKKKGSNKCSISRVSWNG